MRRQGFLRALLGALAALPLLRWLPEIDPYSIWLRESGPRVWASEVSEHGFTLHSPVTDEFGETVRITQETADVMLQELETQEYLMTVTKEVNRGHGWEEVEREEYTLRDTSRPGIPPGLLPG